MHNRKLMQINPQEWILNTQLILCKYGGDHPCPLCDKCGSFDHVTENYQVGNPFAPPHVEHAAYVTNFQPRPCLLYTSDAADE